VFRADAWWGIAALLWLSTGLVRAFGGFEKGSAYYLHNHLFLAKMFLFVLLVVLELGPMAAILRWRREAGRGRAPDTSRAGRFAAVSTVQAVLVVLAAAAAAGLARGHGTIAR
jgi:putative membrane protein